MSIPHPGEFLLPTYETERLKTLTAWSLFADTDLGFRPAELARTPLEHFVHQCVSEDGWMRNMLAVEPKLPALPKNEDRLSFLEHYAAVSKERQSILGARPPEWWGEETAFFDTRRSHAWIFVRRLTHSAHHRGQLTTLLRLIGKPLYSTYGPTADTGGLPTDRAPTIYRYDSIARLLTEEATGGEWPELPGAGESSPTERP